MARTTNEEDIKNSIRHLILTNVGERFYRPRVGSKIQALLFDPIDSVTESLIQATISDTINNYEPRVNLIGVSVVGDANSNSYRVSIYFEIRNIANQKFSLPLQLRRTR